jgi:hypothetical protein
MPNERNDGIARHAAQQGSPLRQLPWLLPAWCYFPLAFWGAAPLARRVPENVFGVVSAVAGLMLLVPFVGLLAGRVSRPLFTWTVAAPTGAVLLGLALFAGD